MPRVDQGEWEPWASAFARAARYRERLYTGRAVLAARSDAERAAVLGGNANRVYRLALVPASQGGT